MFLGIENDGLSEAERIELFCNHLESSPVLSQYIPKETEATKQSL